VGRNEMPVIKPMTKEVARAAIFTG